VIEQPCDHPGQQPGRGDVKKRQAGDWHLDMNQVRMLFQQCDRAILLATSEGVL
jgi:hypothetical protein